MELGLIQVSKKMGGEVVLPCTPIYHLEVCCPTVNNVTFNVIKIKKNAVSGIFCTTELMRSVELTSLWLIFLMYLPRVYI